MRRASLAAVAAVAVLAGLLPLVALPLPARAAAAYSLATRATYTLNPESRRIDVAVAATFENTTPNPPGQFSVFDSLKLAVQDGASAVTARDAAGALGASVARENGVNVVTVKLRRGSGTSGRSTSACRTSSPMGRPRPAGTAERRRLPGLGLRDGKRGHGPGAERLRGED